MGEVLPHAVWQRCYVHFLRNALDHLPRKTNDDCLQELRWIYDRRDKEEAMKDLAQWVERWELNPLIDGPHPSRWPFAFAQHMVHPAGVEPASRPNLGLARYKLAALPLCYGWFLRPSGFPATQLAGPPDVWRGTSSISRL